MRLRELRQESGFTLLEVAQKINTSPQNIQRWEREQNEPSYSYVVKLAEVFGVSVDYLVGASDDDVVSPETRKVHESLSAAEKELLSIFRELGPFEQESIKIQMRALVKAKKPT